MIGLGGLQMPGLLWGGAYGPTANRPTKPVGGQCYFDTTIGAIVAWTGTAWQLSTRAGWHDLIGDIQQAAAVGALTSEVYRDTPELWYWLSRSQNDSLSLKFQMPHDWDPTQAIEPHLHVVGAAPTTGNVRIIGRYAWSHFGDLALPALSGWGTIDTTTQILDTEQWVPKAISLGQLSPPTLAQKPSAFLHLWIQRPGQSDALDTYDGNKPSGTAAANLGLEGLDCHVLRTGLATAGRYA
ncbi:MAG: hypothetical protein ACRC4O_10865 [Giesbergeria sp.]